jgi:hypothetical protein
VERDNGSLVWVSDAMTSMHGWTAGYYSRGSTLGGANPSRSVPRWRERLHRNFAVFAANYRIGVIKRANAITIPNISGIIQNHLRLHKILVDVTDN